MKKASLIVLLLLVLTLAMPAAAERDVPVAGDPISLFYDDDDFSFPANEPFHIRHGWLNNLGNNGETGKFDFKMEILGQEVPLGVPFTLINPDTDTKISQRIYNFHNGMPEGTYTFYGMWYQPCQYQLGSEMCADPNSPVLSKLSTVKITFTSGP